MQQYREILIAIYLDWVNNYISAQTLAERNGLTWQQTIDLLKVAQEVYESQHPDA